MNYKYLSIIAKNKAKGGNFSFLLELENISDSVYDDQLILFHSKLTEIEDYLVGIYLILTGICSIILNSLVIYVCFKQRNLLVASDYFIVNLAVSDLLLPVIGFPFAITSSFGHKWNFGYPGCQAYGFIGFFCGVVSITTLTLMSFVRYVSVCRVELKIIVCQRTGILIFGTYFYASLWAFPPIVGWGDYGVEPHGTSCTLKWSGNKTFVTFMLITCIIMPVIIMNLCYGSVWTYLKKNTKYIAKWTSGRSMWKKREGYLIKITFTMCCAFMGTWTPYAVVSFWSAYGSEKTIPIRVTLTAVLLAKLASVLNPFIYFLMNRKFSPHVKAYLMKTFRSIQFNSGIQ